MVESVKTLKSNMYRSTEGYNIEINGFPFFTETIEGDDFFNRREYNKLNIIGGTQIVTKGAYVPRSFTFTTHVRVEPNNPDVYNKIFQEMMSEPCNIISPELGGMFDGIVVVSPKHSSPSFLEVKIKITEVPKIESNIIGEEIVIPEDKLEDKTDEEKEKEKKEKEVKESIDKVKVNNTDKPKAMGKLSSNLNKNSVLAKKLREMGIVK